jgi:hypothetical protein
MGSRPIHFRTSPIIHRKTLRMQSFPLTARPISYIMLTNKSGWIIPAFWALGPAFFPPIPRFYFFSAVFPAVCCASS